MAAACSRGKLKLDQFDLKVVFLCAVFLGGGVGFFLGVCVFPYQEGGQILEEVVQRDCEISIFGDIQSSAEGGPEQPALTVPALSVCVWRRGFELNDLQSFLAI